MKWLTGEAGAVREAAQCYQVDAVGSVVGERLPVRGERHAQRGRRQDGDVDGEWGSGGLVD